MKIRWQLFILIIFILSSCDNVYKINDYEYISDGKSFVVDEIPTLLSNDSILIVRMDYTTGEKGRAFDKHINNVFGYDHNFNKLWVHKWESDTLRGAILINRDTSVKMYLPYSLENSYLISEEINNKLTDSVFYSPIARPLYPFS